MSAAKKTSRRALGRGLDALLPAAPLRPAADFGDGSVFLCPIEHITPCPDQPRQRLDPDKLAELAESIRRDGLIQPIVVRRVAPQEDRFEIVAGERRWRAVQKAGLKEISVVVKDVSPDKAYILALVENLQRENLNPMELAEAYGRLLEQEGQTQQSVAEQVGKSRTAVANVLRLLKLPRSVREQVVQGVLSEGHARALLGAPDEQAMLTLAEQTVRGRLPVRHVERLVRAAKRKQAAGADDPPAAPAGKSPEIRDLELRLTRRLGARVEVSHQAPGGKLTVRYGTLDELDRILAALGV